MKRQQRFADLPVRIEQREITVDGRSCTYGMLVPKASADAAGYPLVVGLHYSSPTPGLSPYFGLGFVGQLILPALQELNAILVAPDAPDATWTSEVSERLVLAVLAEVKKEFSADARRVLVAGFSMGGTGAWFLAAKHPELFRAAVIVAAPPPASDTKPGVPVYVIHSRQDDVAPFAATEAAVRTLEQQGVKVTFAPVGGLTHRDASSYADALHAAIPWIRQIWQEK